MYSGDSRISEMGVPTPKGASTYYMYLANFSRKMRENEDILVEGVCFCQVHIWSHKPQIAFIYL